MYKVKRPSIQFWMLCVVLWVFSFESPYAADLKSPWDSIPKAEKAGDVECPIATQLSANLKAESYYVDEARSVVDENRRDAYKASVDSYRQSAIQVVALADQYRATGNGKIPSCVAGILNSMAKDNALGGRMNGPQAYTVRAWMLNAYATAWLKVRVGLGKDEPARKSVLSWLDRLAKDTAAYNTKRNRRNNLRYWAGLGVMSVGIAANDQSLFDWGVESYKIGVSQIAVDGVLPAEMRRGDHALLYHAFAAGPLVMMAELAKINGLDLYKENNNALARLVAFVVHGIDDSSLIKQRVGVDPKEIRPKSNDMAWLHLYARQFPNTAYVSLLKRFPRDGNLYLGGVVP